MFPNDRPEVSQLAQDRWKILKIKDNDLEDVTNSRIFKKKLRFNSLYIYMD